MREQVRDKGRLEHITQAMQNVIDYTRGMTMEQLESNSLVKHATAYNIQIIGEAVYKLTEEFKNSHPDTPWKLIEKMRHILVHDYYQVNIVIMWDVISIDIPNLKPQIEKYLKELQ